jgi:very-short-patch-repair endonuclease
LSVTNGSILSLAGIDDREVCALLDNVEPSDGVPRALSIAIRTAASAEEIVEAVISDLAETALHMWPMWYQGFGVAFNICRNDPLGRQAAGVLAVEAASKVSGVLPFWAEQAAISALSDRVPRVARLPASTEFAQLTKAIAPNGLVLVVSPMLEGTRPRPEAIVRALEWISKICGVVALFNELPANEPPFDRILYGALVVSSEAALAPHDTMPNSEPWLAPWRGLPHPLSDVEKRLAKALATDRELSELFHFNQSILTVRGSRPKVDLLWMEGRLVVELDGYESHGNRTAFAQDRHRDYELLLSGFAVLRLTNAEIAQDCEKALEKIRDLVRLRRETVTKEV